MKNFVRDAIIAVTVSIVIISTYVFVDFMYTPKATVAPLKMSKIKPRKFVVFEGKERNELDFVRVLVIDTLGDGIKTGKADEYASVYRGPKRNFYFDFNNDGFGELAPCLESDDVFLVHRMDTAADDTQLQGGEIVGNHFKANKLGDKADSFGILQKFNNGGEKINKGDRLYNELEAWSPCAAGKLSPKAVLNKLWIEGIKSIELKPKNYKKLDASGNILGKYAEVEFESGRKSKIQEVWLYTNTTTRGYYDSIAVVDEDIKKLPNVRGVGTLYSLHEAMQKDGSGRLKKLVIKYTKEPNYFVRRALLLDILYHWAGVGDADIKSRISEDGKNYIGDARKILFLEKLIGKAYRGTHTGSDETLAPHVMSTPIVLTSFNTFADYVDYRLLQETQLEKLLDKIDLKWNRSDQKWEIDVSKTFNIIKEFHLQHGKLQTKLLLNNLYWYLNFSSDNSGKETWFSLDRDLYDGVIDKFRTSGEIISEIDMKKFGNFVMIGGANSDSLAGSDGDDIIIGRDGDDLIEGKLGHDAYIFNLNDGNDTIVDQGGDDEIAFGGDILFENVSFSLDKLDLLININSGENGTIRIKNFAKDDNYKIEKVLFANNHILHLKDILLKLYKENWWLYLKANYYKRMNGISFIK